MRTIPAVAVMVIASLVLASCVAQQADVSALRKTVEEYNAASMNAMKGGDLEKVLPYYEEEAMEMPPNMAMVKGRENIRGFMEQMSQSGMKITNVTFETIELDASGKVGYEVGTYEMSMSVPVIGDVTDKGKYMVVWRQQQDGSWKVRGEIWNSDVPLPAADVAKKEDKKKK